MENSHGDDSGTSGGDVRAYNSGRPERGTAFGRFNLVNGVALLFASSGPGL